MRRGIPENFETDVDEKFLSEVREEQRKEQERGGPKVYRKGTTISSVYTYTIPTTSTTIDECGDTLKNGTSICTLSCSTSDTDNSELSARKDEIPSQKKRGLYQISLETDEMTVAQFLATTGSSKASKANEKEG